MYTIKGDAVWEVLTHQGKERTSLYIKIVPIDIAIPYRYIWKQKRMHVFSLKSIY